MTKPLPRPKVGILLVTNGKNGDYVAHLQMRGVHDYRKDCPQTWPGIYQVTAEGKKHPHESNLDALRRELREELGQPAGEFIFKMLVGDGIRSNAILLHKEDITIYQLLVPSDLFKDYGIRLENITGGLRPIAREDVIGIRVARPEWRTTIHPYSLNTIIVKPYVKKALEMLFKNYPKLKKRKK